MLSKTEFLREAELAYDKWLAEQPETKSAYDYEKDFETWFLELGRKLLEGDPSQLGTNRNHKKKL